MAIYYDKNANSKLMRNADLQRMSVFIETKRELNKRLMELPDGNLEKLAKLNGMFDEIIEEELSRLESGRQLDENKPLHGGNVEYCGSYTDDREACEALAASLNKQEGGE